MNKKSQLGGIVYNMDPLDCHHFDSYRELELFKPKLDKLLGSIKSANRWTSNG
jgi:hypothetical protein